METVIFILYWIIAYMALNKVWYSKRTYIVYDSKNFFIKKAAIAVALGWILIPVALIQMIFSSRK